MKNIFVRNLRFIQNNGIIFFLKKKYSRIIGLALSPFIIIFSLIFVCLVRIISPVLIVRWCCLISTRIGHFSVNPEIYICIKKVNGTFIKKRHIDIFYFRSEVCNVQLAKMWKRELLVLPSLFMMQVNKINRFFELFIKSNHIHEIGNPMQFSRIENKSDYFYGNMFPGFTHIDRYNLLDRYSPNLRFTKKEIVKGQKLLNQLGVKHKKPFVCLIVRDSSYLNKFMTSNSWDYHNFRDCDIDNFKESAKWLASKGYYVLRMGATVNSNFECDSPYIIDYANSEFQTDFMDIYLMANCFFCLSTNTGLDGVSEIFRRPIVSVNCVPIADMRISSNRFLLLSKHYYSKSLKRNLTLNEIFRMKLSGITEVKEFSKKGIILKENTSKEIMQAVREMEQKLNNPIDKKVIFHHYKIGFGLLTLIIHLEKDGL